MWINYLGIPLDVTISYRPGHPGQTSGPLDQCEEPIPPELEILSIHVPEGTDIVELLDNFDTYRLEDLILKQIEGE